MSKSKAKGPRKTRAQSKAEATEVVAALRARGCGPHEIFTELTRANIEFTERRAQETGCCPECWLSTRDGTCICAAIHPVPLRTPLRLLVWVHQRDYCNAGNSGSTLLQACAGQAISKLLLFGRMEDDAALAAALRESPGRAMLLFPGEGSISVSQFLLQCAAASSSEPEPEHEAGVPQQPITVVVPDGTWQNVKQMVGGQRRAFSYHLPFSYLYCHTTVSHTAVFT